MIELANATNENQLHKHEFRKEFNISNLDTFEEVIEIFCGYMLIQNILDFE